MKKPKGMVTVKLSDVISTIDLKISHFQRELKDHSEYDRYTLVAAFRAMIDAAEIVKSYIVKQCK
jgi:hypothetical protein